jgi:glycosyltransferase involved in cell wall biosynthesis
VKVLYFSQPFYPFQYGGSEKVFFLLSREISKKHKCLVIAQRVKGLKDREIVDGVEIIRVGLPVSSYLTTFSNSFLIDFSYFLEAFFVGLKEGRKFDIIHSNPFIGSFVAKFVSFVLRKKHLVMIHDVFLQKGYHKSLPVWKQKIGKIVELFLLNSRFILTPSETTKKDILEVKKNKGSKIFVVPNGIEISKYKCDKKENIGVYVGRLVFYKNIDFLIRMIRFVVNREKEFKLIIIGSGPELEKLKRLSKSYGVEKNVIFKGNVSEEEKLELLSKAKLFLFPSSLEGFGISVIEAMACGDVVIVNDVEPLNKIVKDSKNGFALPLSEKKWAIQILKILRNEKLRKVIEKNAIKTARKYDIKKTSKQVEKIYKGIIRN